MSGPDPTAGAGAIHSFVLLFPGQVLTDSRLRLATGMQTLWDLYHSIPLDELIPMVPFPSLPDNWLLSYPPFLPPDLNIHVNHSNPTPFKSPHRADSNGLCPDLIRPLVQELSTPL